jgi:hypothetical protein
VTQLTLEWKPRNITEWMFARDIADISWEIFRHESDRTIAERKVTSCPDAIASWLKQNVVDLARVRARAAPRDYGKLKAYLGRVIRDIGRRIDGDADLEEVFAPSL